MCSCGVSLKKFKLFSYEFLFKWRSKNLYKEIWNAWHMDLHLIKAPVILIMQYEYRESVSLATDKHELKFRLENY